MGRIAFTLLAGAVVMWCMYRIVAERLHTVL